VTPRADQYGLPAGGFRSPSLDPIANLATDLGLLAVGGDRDDLDFDADIDREVRHLDGAPIKERIPMYSEYTSLTASYSSMSVGKTVALTTSSREAPAVSRIVDIFSNTCSCRKVL